MMECDKQTGWDDLAENYPRICASWLDEPVTKDDFTREQLEESARSVEQVLQMKHGIRVSVETLLLDFPEHTGFGSYPLTVAFVARTGGNQRATVVVPATEFRACQTYMLDIWIPLRIYDALRERACLTATDWDLFRDAVALHFNGWGKCGGYTLDILLNGERRGLYELDDGGCMFTSEPSGVSAGEFRQAGLGFCLREDCPPADDDVVDVFGESGGDCGVKPEATQIVCEMIVAAELEFYGTQPADLREMPTACAGSCPE